MTNYAYIRISTAHQSPKAQRFGVLDYCNKQGLSNVKITIDTCTGAIRPEKRKLGKIIDDMKAGDNLIITEVSRLGRSLRDVLDVLEQVKNIGATVHVIKQALVLSEKGNTAGKLVVAMYSIFAEMERELIQQRVKEGINSAKARGVKFGRPKGWCKKLKLDEKEDEIRALLPMNLPVLHMARIFSVSPRTMKLWIARKIDKQKKIGQNPKPEQQTES